MAERSSTSQFVPKGMRVTAERLAAFTRNRFKIENAGSNDAMPGQIITVTLPSNTLVDLHSLKMHGRFQAIGGGIMAKGESATDKFDDDEIDSFSIKPGPPDDFHQLVSRMTVSANGTAIQQGCIEYNTVHKVKSLLDRPKPQQATVDNSIGAYAATRPTPASSKATLIYSPKNEAGKQAAKIGDKLGTHTLLATDFFESTGRTYTLNKANGATTSNHTNVQGNVEGISKIANLTNGENGVGLDTKDFTLYDWRGFFKECSVRYLPTDLVGAVQIQLTLAGAEILPWVGRESNGGLVIGDHVALYGLQQNGVGKADTGVRAPSYKLNDLYWTIDTISVDQAYGDMLRGKIAQNGYISLLFKEYYTFSKSAWDGDSDQHRFSLSAGSLDKVYSVIRDSKYNIENHPIKSWGSGDHSGYTPMMEFICPSLPYWNYGFPYHHGVADSVVAQSNYAMRPSWHFDVDGDASTKMRYNYKINSVMHPQYDCGARDAIWDCSYGHDNVNGPNAGNQIASRGAWFEHCAIFPCLLNLTDGPLQLMSGYDSRGHSSFIEFNIDGIALKNYKKLTYNKLQGPGSGKATIGLMADIDSASCYEKLTTTSIVETTSELRVGAGLSLVVAR